MENKLIEFRAVNWLKCESDVNFVVVENEIYCIYKYNFVVVYNRGMGPAYNYVQLYAYPKEYKDKRHKFEIQGYYNKWGKLEYYDSYVMVRDIVRNLLYKDGDKSNGIGIGTITEDCHRHYNPDDPDAQNCMMSQDEWIEVLKAIQADEILCSLTIHKVEDHREDATDGFRAMALTGDKVDENIIIFKGTSSTASEWVDNGQGGYSV